jgi:hypothetical protein
MTLRFTTALAALATAFSLASCGGGGIGGTGSMRVSVTDAPSCFAAVNVTIEKVRVHQRDNASDADSGWSEVVLNPPKRIDLVPLTNGVLEELGETRLPAGTYTQLRLVLAENSAANPLANAVTPIGGAPTALDTPSGQQSGLKMKVNLSVEADQLLDVVLDFDACKSVVTNGSSGDYNLKPVLSVTPVVSEAGMRVVGYVDPSLALASTNVSVQAGGVPVKATPPDATGKFVLYPVPAGQYDLVVSSAGRVTAVMTGVPVTTTAWTTVNTAAMPILPPVATGRSVAGGVAPATATVRALQTLAGGPTLEVARGAVDASSGAFAFELPVQAPVATAYVANPPSLVFVANAAAAGKYTLEAASAGATKTQAIDVSAAVAPVVFTFP